MFTAGPLGGLLARALARTAALLRASALVASFAPVAAAQSVWVVDPAGAITQIQDAVDLAADGDVILVRPGTYERVDIAGKSLSIHAEDGATVQHVVFVPILGTPDRALDVSGVGAGQRVVIRGLSIELIYLEPFPAVWVQGCDGAIAFEDCQFTASSGPAVLVDGSDAVSFTRSIVGPGGPFLPAASSAWEQSSSLRVNGSTVYLYDTHVIGSRGHDAIGFVDTLTSPGGPGLDLVSGLVFASGSILEGGQGGGVDPIAQGACIPVSGGGPAYQMDDLFGPSRLVLFDTVAIAGAGAQAPGGCGLPDGAPGPDPIVLGGDVVNLAGQRRTFGVASVWRESALAEAAYFGLPGDAVLLFLSAPGALPVLVEPLALAGFVDPIAFTFQFRGVTGGSGALFDALPIGALPPGVDAVPLVTQAAFVDTSGALFASGPSHTVLVDAAF